MTENQINPATDHGAALIDLSLAALKARLKAGILQMTGNQAIAGLTPILLVPFYLRAWGPAGYGHWVSLTALVSYLALFDFGGQPFIANLMAAEFSKGCETELRQYLSEGVSLFLVVAIIALCGLGLVLCLPTLPFSGRTLHLSIADRSILFLMGANFLQAIPAGVYAATYRSTGLFSRGVFVGNVTRLVGLACSVTMLVAFAREVAFAGAYLAAGIISTVAVVVDTRHRIPACRHLRVSLAAARGGLRHLSGALHFWLLAIANALNQQGILLVLAAFAGSTSVATYSSHRTMAGVVGYVGLMVQGPLWPEFTFFNARKDQAGMRRISRTVLEFVLFMSIMTALLLWAIAPSIYRVWTRSRLAFDPFLFALFLIQAVSAAGWNTSGWSLTATNRHRSLAYWALANGVITITLAVWLVPLKGMLGAAIATLAGDLLCGAVIYPVLASRLLLVRARDLSLWMLSPVAFGCGVSIMLVVAGFVTRGWLLTCIRLAILFVTALLGTQLILQRGRRAWLEVLHR